MSMANILIIGRLPPPIGGVTIHVSRLIENLERIGFKNFDFADLNEGLPGVLWKFVTNRAIHLHLSNPYWQLCVALICRLLLKKLVVTYHGNWGRYHLAGNLAVTLSCWLAHTPIIQNEESFKKAFQWNRNAKLISTYLHSDHIAPLDPDNASLLLNFTKKYKLITCTNAWNVAFDKYGKEIYGISELVEWTAENESHALIISDPSGNYAPFIKQRYQQISANVLFLSIPHDFRNVLKVSDAFIRNTSTDGVSLSICEALALNVPVLASDSVSRPAHCRIFKSLWQLDLESEIVAGRKLLSSSNSELCGGEVIQRLIAVYQEILADRS